MIFLDWLQGAWLRPYKRRWNTHELCACAKMLLSKQSSPTSSASNHVPFPWLSLLQHLARTRARLLYLGLFLPPRTFTLCLSFYILSLRQPSFIQTSWHSRCFILSVICLCVFLYRYGRNDWWMFNVSPAHALSCLRVCLSHCLCLSSPCLPHVCLTFNSVITKVMPFEHTPKYKLKHTKRLNWGF